MALSAMAMGSAPTLAELSPAAAAAATGTTWKTTPLAPWPSTDSALRFARLSCGGCEGAMLTIGSTWQQSRADNKAPSGVVELKGLAVLRFNRVITPLGLVCL